MPHLYKDITLDNPVPIFIDKTDNISGWDRDTHIMLLSGLALA